MKRFFLAIITILLLSATQASANYLAYRGGSGQRVEVGETFEEPIKYQVWKSRTDNTGVPNVTVNFKLTRGNPGTWLTNPVIFSINVTTDANGFAQIRLKGASVGTYTIAVSIQGQAYTLLAAAFVLESDAANPFETPETPPTIPHRYTLSGNNQVGEIGTELEHPLIVKIFDENDNPIPNITVSFGAIVDGELCYLEVDTDANGEAGIYFTLGNTAESYQVYATFEVDKKWEIVFTVYTTGLPATNEPTPPLNPTPNPTLTDGSDPDPQPVVNQPQTLDPNEIWHVMYRNDNGQATVFVYPRCLNNASHSPPKPPCENNYGITEALFFQMSSNFSIEMQGSLEEVNNHLDLQLEEDNARLVQVSGVQGVVN